MSFDLKTTQQSFWRLVASPGGMEGKALSDFVAEKEKGEAFERTEIYSRMYFNRLHDSIAEDYPALKNWAGEERFHSLMVDYLQTHPSRSFDLADAGKALPLFLEDHPLKKEFPFLPDLARLEWLKIELFREADERPLEKEALKNIPPDRWGSLFLKTIPALRLLKTAFPILEIWQEGLHENTEKIVAPLSKPQTILAWRKDFQVFFLDISEDEGEWLEDLSFGITFESLCEKIAEEEKEDPTRKAALLLSQWIDRKILIGGEGV